MKLIEIKNEENESEIIRSMERLIFFKPNSKIDFAISTDVNEAYQPANEVTLDLSVPN